MTDTTKAPEAVGHECPANHDAYARMGFGACPYCCTSLEGIRAAFASPGAPSPLPLEGREALREKVAQVVFERFSPNKDWKCWADCGVLGRPTYLEAADAILSALQSGGGNG